METGVPTSPGLYPDSGSPLGGEAVTVRGSGFTTATTVVFGQSQPSPVRLVSSAELAVVAPPGSGTVQVTVTTPVAAGGSAAVTYPFTYNDLTIDVIRPDDLLVLRFQLANLTLANGVLTRLDASKPAYVVAHFPPQHLAESAFSGPMHGAPIPAALAGPSRLAFEVPAGTTSMRLDLATLLGWHAFTVTPLPPDPPTVPSQYQSVLELPYRLHIGADPATTWTFPSTPDGVKPVTDPATGAVELWRARARTPAQGRVLWSPDLDPARGGGADPGSPLSADLRKQIAQQAPAVTFTNLTLSALGAWLDLEATMPGPGLTSWRHVADGGRDTYVRTVQHGFLAPFGHRAAHVTTFQRQPADSPSGEPVEAVIRSADGSGTSSDFIVITQPEVDFTAAEVRAAYLARTPGGMPCPFQRVRFATALTTPPLSPLPDDQPALISLAGASVPYPFHMQAVDLSDAVVDLRMPLTWVPLETVDGGYTGTSESADVGGQQVAFVPPAASAGPREAPAPPLSAGSLLATAMSFNVASEPTPVGPAALRFLPALEQAVVKLPGIDHLQGTASSWAIKYHDDFLQQRGGNRAQVFAELLNPGPITLPPDRAGGLVAPQLPVGALSQALGPIAGELAGGTFDPSQIAGLDVKLLGSIPLAAILQTVSLPSSPSPADFSKLPAITHMTLPSGMHTSFRWSPVLKQEPIGVGSFLSVDLTGATLDLQVDVTAPVGTGTPEFVVVGVLKNFTLRFLDDAIELDVDMLKFCAQSHRKVDLTTGKDLRLRFPPTGKLAFVNVLAAALPGDGFADPPYVDATPSGVVVGYTLGLPAIGAGAFSIENISFTAALDLPLDGGPLGLRLAFSRPEHQFLVTLSFIGGGGFFAVDVGTGGINEIQGSLELGGNLSLDLALVTANVHVLAGFYFAWTASDVAFSAFLRVGGSVDLLGLISVSVELCLALGYNSGHTAVEGSASLTLSVHVLFTSKSITLTVHKSFPVPGAADVTAIAPAASMAVRAVTPPTPPGATFHLTMPLGDWQTYCQAFS
jgi:hypothetical protein